MKKTLLITLIALTLSLISCNSGGNNSSVNSMPSGSWQLNFAPGILSSTGNLSVCNNDGESQNYTTIVQPITESAAAYQSSALILPQNQIFYGNFTQTLNNGRDPCFNGYIGSNNGISTVSYSCPALSTVGNRVQFYGCSITEINFSYFFSATYRILNNNGDTLLQGNVSGYSGQ